MLLVAALKERLEVYRLVDGEYVLQAGNPVWLPEIELGIGRERGTYLGRTRFVVVLV